MNKKTIIGIVLVPIALFGICGGGAMMLLGVGKRVLRSAESTQPAQTDPSPASPLDDRAETPADAPARIPIATKEPARLGDTEAWIVSVWQWTDDNGNLLVRPESNEKSPLYIRIRLVNKSTTRKIDYESWQKALRENGPFLTDEHRNTYRSVNLGLFADDYGHIESGSTAPGEWIDDVLLFESPLDVANTLSLELSGDAVGEQGSIRFAIPRKTISLIPSSQSQGQKR